VTRVVANLKSSGCHLFSLCLDSRSVPGAMAQPRWCAASLRLAGKPL